MKHKIDVVVRNEGSIFMFQPLTKTARAWIEENAADDGMWFGGQLAVEHRYAADLAQGMLNDGLNVA